VKVFVRIEESRYPSQEFKPEPPGNEWPPNWSRMLRFVWKCCSYSQSAAFMNTAQAQKAISFLRSNQIWYRSEAVMFYWNARLDCGIWGCHSGSYVVISGIERRVVLMWTDVSERYITCIFRVENQWSKKPACSTWLGLRTTRRDTPTDGSIRSSCPVSGETRCAYLRYGICTLRQRAVTIVGSTEPWMETRSFGPDSSWPSNYVLVK
jgi:hypothetical protein